MLKNKYLKIGLFLLIVLICVSCDQTTKVIAKAHLEYAAPINYLNGTFKLMYKENTGAFLGLGENLPAGLKYLLLVFLPTLVLFLFAATFLKASTSYLQFMAVSLIIAGGIGNMIDRITAGAVVDFMNIGFGNIRTGIFNFADLFITFGLILLLLGFRNQTQ